MENKRELLKTKWASFHAMILLGIIWLDIIDIQIDVIVYSQSGTLHLNNNLLRHGESNNQ